MSETAPGGTGSDADGTGVLHVRHPVPSADASAPEPAGGVAAGGDGTGAPSGRVRHRWRAEPWLFLEIFALCGFVVVQPMLDIIGGSPDFFIFHGISGLEVAVLVAAFVLIPPVALWGIGALTGFAGARPRRLVHVGTVAVLVTLFLIELGKYVTPTGDWLPSVRGVWLVLVAVALAAVVLVGYVKLSATRQLLRYAAIGPLVFVLLFTFASPANAVLFTEDQELAAGLDVPVVGEQPPVVMMILDELALVTLLDTDGTIDEERFPHFAELAGDSTWFRNATTNAGWTPYALPSMLTSTWPSQHVAPHYSAYEKNLFTLLGEEYRLSASESISQLCPAWHCGNLDRSRGGLPVAFSEATDLLGEMVSPVDQESSTYDDFAEPTVADRLGRAAAAAEEGPEFLFEEALSASQPVRFHDFMTELRETAEAYAAGERPETPPMHFLHLLMPHTPWTYLPDGMRYDYVQLPIDGEWWGRLAYQRYEAQLQYTDLLLGETLDVMQSTGFYDEALFALTSDHGVNLTPGDPGVRELPPDHPGIPELAWVPMFLKAPGQTEGVVEDGNWQHVDLVPTVADYAGVEVPWEVEGISWREETRETTAKPFYGDLEIYGEIDGPPLFDRLLAEPRSFPAVPPAPLPELVGTPVDAHPVVAGDARAEFANPGAFSLVDRGSGSVPALVHGSIGPDVPEGTPLAIAVNGTIGAVAPVVPGAEQQQFAALVRDHELFVDGRNEVEVFVVPDGETLRPATG